MKPDVYHHVHKTGKSKALCNTSQYSHREVYRSVVTQYWRPYLVECPRMLFSAQSKSTFQVRVCAVSVGNDIFIYVIQWQCRRRLTKSYIIIRKKKRRPFRCGLGHIEDNMNIGTSVVNFMFHPPSTQNIWLWLGLMRRMPDCFCTYTMVRWLTRGWQLENSLERLNEIAVSWWVESTKRLSGLCKICLRILTL
jgi:hypothetical protein